MIWVLLIVVAVLVVVATAAVVVGRFTPDPMADPVTSTPHHGLPAGTVRSGDVAEVTFDTALRGYRMDQVDDVIDRLQQRIAELENEGRDTRRP
ncbi:DivIVA domain-containing protein [Janibacter sp. DB-40]|uniref:DivIVA domain-containing protein n=1 Tax=Janibacter sp. DB-40 TaxID=3028808 RepID=UPI0024075E4F|nr:DivIVA domain-containing protein [Janibacter sp. DB-40]